MSVANPHIYSHRTSGQCLVHSRGTSRLGHCTGGLSHQLAANLSLLRQNITAVQALAIKKEFCSVTTNVTAVLHFNMHYV